MIQLVIATNENYLPGAIATLTSARMFTTQEDDIHVTCLHDDLSAEKQNYLIDLVDSLHGQIFISFIQLDVSKFKNCPEFWTEGKSLLPYARLLLGSLLPSHIDKVLYLDVDLLVKCNLKQLYSISLGNYEIAACIDKICPTLRDDYPCEMTDFEIIKYKDYFNSGVMLINLSKIRTTNSFLNVLDMLNKGSNQSFKYADQSALNYYYQGNFLKLDDMWNIQLHSQNYSQIELQRMLDQSYRGIFHFVSKAKPWNSFSYHPIYTQHRRFLNTIAPFWTSKITYFKEKKFKTYQKKLSILMIFRSYLLFMLSSADESKMATLVYWIKFYQQKKFFKKVPPLLS